MTSSDRCRKPAGARSTCCVLMFSLWAGICAAEISVNLVGDPWPPYVNGELGEFAESGVGVEIIKRVFAQLDDAEVRFPLIPWERALLEVERGQSDGIAMLLKTAERERFITFSVPLVTGYNLIWSVAEADGSAYEWSAVEDLYGKRVGIVKGYSYGDEMDRSFEQGMITAVEAPNVGQLFAMLAAGRVSLIMANDAVGYELARGYDDVAIKPSARPTNSETFYIGISKKSPAAELIPRINAAIEKLRREGTIERIVRGKAVDPISAD